MKTPNGNVEARVACFYRRRDISSYLVNQVDRLKLDGSIKQEISFQDLFSFYHSSMGR